MAEIKKIYRVFISSCTRLLESERRILSGSILDAGHLPVQMESNFSSSNITYSLETDMKKIEESDCVIVILSYLYGEQIGSKINECSKCPFYTKKAKIPNCLNCHSATKNFCQLSFTQFEYEYAKLIGKPLIVIFNRKCDDISSFKDANNVYSQGGHGNCEEDFYKLRSNNQQFVQTATIKHVNPYTTPEEFIRVCSTAVKTAEQLIFDKEQESDHEYGLIPYLHYYHAKDAKKTAHLRLENLQNHSIETVYDNQKEAIESILIDSSNLYFGENGKIAPIKVLAIRGDSFVKMGHDWCKFILDDEFKDDEHIPIEFILGNDQNETLISGRYSAFKKKNNASNEDYLKFKDRYQDEMRKVHDTILKEGCSLFLHSEARLPFRMVFIGKYLYLSSFANDKKAAETPVMKIKSSSSLYEVCAEYYDWVKKSSFPHPLYAHTREEAK